MPSPVCLSNVLSIPAAGQLSGGYAVDAVQMDEHSPEEFWLGSDRPVDPACDPFETTGQCCLVSVIVPNAFKPANPSGFGVGETAESSHPEAENSLSSTDLVWVASNPIGPASAVCFLDSDHTSEAFSDDSLAGEEAAAIMISHRISSQAGVGMGLASAETRELELPPALLAAPQLTASLTARANGVEHPDTGNLTTCESVRRGAVKPFSGRPEHTPRHGHDALRRGISELDTDLGEGVLKVGSPMSLGSTFLIRSTQLAAENDPPLHFPNSESGGVANGPISPAQTTLMFISANASVGFGDLFPKTDFEAGLGADPPMLQKAPQTEAALTPQDKGSQLVAAALQPVDQADQTSQPNENVGLYEVLDPALSVTPNSVIAVDVDRSSGIHRSISQNLPLMTNQIVEGLALGDSGTTTLRLAPEELGHVRLTFRHDPLSADGLVVMLGFDRPETLDLFRRHAGQLIESLRVAGFSDVQLNFSSNSDGGPFERRRDDTNPRLITSVGDRLIDELPGPTTISTGRLGSLNLRL